MTEFVFEQIGVIRSPYKEKFAVPRQPGLVEDGGGELLLIRNGYGDTRSFVLPGGGLGLREAPLAAAEREWPAVQKTLSR